MGLPVVLFDLDGTLIDSGAIILASMRHATKTVLEREIPDEVLVASVGGSSLHEQMRVIDAERVDELVDCYREHNEPLHDTLVCFPGILDVLDTLRAEGRRLGIVTAKRRVTVDLAFARLPLQRYFDTVVTSEQTVRHKPHAEPILLALDRLGGRPEQAAYVGDSPFDMGAARAAGVKAVAVSWGGIHPLDQLDADVVVETPEELLGVI